MDSELNFLITNCNFMKTTNKIFVRPGNWFSPLATACLALFLFVGQAAAQPGEAAPDPECDQEVISMFSGAYTDVTVNTWLTPWSAATGGNIVPIAGNDTRLYENVDFLGIEPGTGNEIDASGMTTFNVDVWTSNMTVFRVKLVDNSGPQTEGEIAFTPTQSGWNTFSIPLADFANPALVTGPTLQNTTSIFQLIFSGLPVRSGSFYVDNIYFSTCKPPPPPPSTEVEVEFCVDLNCFPVSDAVALAGSFNNFNPGADFLTQNMGDRIYCKTLDLNPGTYDFKFFFAQQQFENLAGAGACVVSSPGAPTDDLARRITVEEGMPQSVTFGWETCEDNCPAPPTADIELCVDLSCFSAVDAVAVVGAYNGYNPGADFLQNTGNGIYCKTVELPAGENDFMFFFAQGQFENLDIAEDCTVNAPAPNGVARRITVVEDVTASYTYLWESCAPSDQEPPVAVCLSPTVEIQPDGTYAVQESDVYDAANSTDNCGIVSVEFSSTVYDCADAGQNFQVVVTATDAKGNFDDCIAYVSVEVGDALPSGWAATDIGDQGDGSSYSYDPCASNNPNRGDFTISTGGYNLIPQNADNLAFTSRELCNNGGIQARIESISGGYAGLMIRESNAPGSKMVAVYSNLTSLLRRDLRTVENGARSSSLSFASFPYWLRLVRQGDYIRGFYRNSDGGSWQPFYQVYLPMENCVEMGLAVFSTDPNGDATAVFNRVQYLSQGNNGLSVPQGMVWEAETDNVLKAVVQPNPVRSNFTLTFTAPLPASGSATLLNEFGQRLSEQVLQAGDTHLDWNVGDLPGGFYFLEVVTKDGFREVLKVVRQ
jgi:hypothetical protein